MSNRFGLAPGSVAVVLGTRPEIVKLAHIINLLGDAGRVIHTGQHYDRNLSDDIFKDLSLLPPEVFLGVGGSTRGTQIGDATRLLDQHFSSNAYRAVVVQGDTNSVLAGALAANAGGLFLCHIEAGLRSHDRAMPEEHNRVVADHLSDLCCAPTEVAVANLTNEGIDANRIVQTGNTVVEAVQGLLPAPPERIEIARSYRVEPGRFILATFHRPENVDDARPFRAILETLGRLPLPVVLPLHPRSAASAVNNGLTGLLDRLIVTEPIGYRDFLALEAESALMVSDSGGIAEEASVVKRPLVVVRRSTERPEVMGTFAIRVEPGEEIYTAAIKLIEDGWDHLQDTASPYGDGTASSRSLQALAERIA